jgi:hypothetical protein
LMRFCVADTIHLSMRLLPGPTWALTARSKRNFSPVDYSYLEMFWIKNL